MKRFVAAGLIVVTALWAGGCVSKSSYMEAQEQADAARTELERERQRKVALEEQVKTLKELNAKLGQEAQLVKDELQRIEFSRDQERGSLEERTVQMERQLRTLVAQHRALRKQYQDMKRQNKTLRATVARYKKELKERPATETGTAPMGGGKPSAPKPKPVTSAKATKPSASVKPPAPSNGSAGLSSVGAVNLNQASVAQMMQTLGLPRDVAERVVSNRPYRIKGELVAKNVMTKEEFDKIKGRVTVRQ